jgi:hypothetical protein
MIRAEELERERRRLAFVEGVRALLKLDRHTDPAAHWAEPDAKLRQIESLLMLCDGANR